MSNQLLVCICTVAFVIGGARSAAVMNMPQISKMEVQCAKSGMTVDVEFDQPFDGIIFSKGHFSDPACRYVGANSNVARFSFLVPMQGCGTSSDADGGSNVASNIIVIQNDAIVQEIWDSAQKLSCRWTDRVTKTVSVRPLTIDMLEAVDAKVADAEDDVVDIWMDLQQGKWPNSGPIESAVRIGEQLSLIVGLNDPSATMDLQVRDCYAHSMPELADPAAFRVQLTDPKGCVMKSKLIGPFVQDRSTNGPYAGSTVRWSPVSAFAFPDNMQVFTSCNVEVCKGGCEPNPCQPTGDVPSGGILLPESDTTTPKAPPKATSTPSVTVPSTTLPPRTSTAPTTAVTATIRITTTTTRPTQAPTTPAIVLPEITLPSLDYLPPYPSKPAEPKCVPGSKDPKCNPVAPPPPLPPAQARITLPPNVTPPTTTLEPPPPPPPQVTTAKTITTTTTTQYVCQPGSDDPRCPTSPPLPVTTTEVIVDQLVCTPESKDPRCPPPATASPPPCYPGSDNPDCVDRNPKEVPLPVICVPGSRDPECVVAGGSNESPVTASTVAPTRPTAQASTDKAPPSPAPSSKEGAPDSWKGDPATHAFHMFHFQRGDGRRGGRRIPIAKRPIRSVDSEEAADGRAEFAQVRLTRSVKVLPAAVGAEPVVSSVEFFRQQETSDARERSTEGHHQHTYCMTTFSLAASAVLVVTAMLGLVVIIVFLAVRYHTARKQLDKMAMRR